MKAHSPPADANWLSKSAQALDRLEDAADLAAAVRAVAERKRMAGDSSDVLPPAAQLFSDSVLRDAAARDPRVIASFNSTVDLYFDPSRLYFSGDTSDQARRRRDTEPDPTS